MILFLILISSTYVHGYTKHNGTYVEPYHRSDANDTKYDNYSSRGSINPYTGHEGTVAPSRSESYFDRTTRTESGSLFPHSENGE